MFATESKFLEAGDVEEVAGIEPSDISNVSNVASATS